jgi:hypothetical protein
MTPSLLVAYSVVMRGFGARRDPDSGPMHATARSCADPRSLDFCPYCGGSLVDENSQLETRLGLENGRDRGRHWGAHERRRRW